MSLKESIATLSSHFEHMTLNFSGVSSVQPVQASGYPLFFKTVNSRPHTREYTSHHTTSYFTFDPKANPSITHFPSFPAAENDIQAETYSPSRDFRALFRKNGDKTILEIWSKTCLIKSLRVSDLHGAIYSSPEFCSGRGITWSQDEKKIAYIAEKKEEKFPKYFDDFANDEEASRALKTFEYRQDLGESYRGKVTPTLFLYEIQEEQLYRVANIPPEIIPTQLSFADKQGSRLVFCGYKFKAVRFGIKYCYNRDSKIYYVNKLVLERLKEDKTKKLSEDEKKVQKEKIKQEGEENKPTLISDDDIAVFPVLNQDLTKLVYVFSPWTNTHTTGFGLKLIDLPIDGFSSEGEKSKPKLVLDIVHERNPDFAGIMGYHEKLNTLSFLPNSKFIVFNSDIRSAVGLFILNIETKEVRRIDKPKFQSEEWKLNQTQNELLFARISNIESQSRFAIYEGINTSADSIDEAIKNAKWHIFDTDPKQSSQGAASPKAFLNNIGEIEEKIIEQNGIESVFFSLKEFKDSKGNLVPVGKRPLMVLLHGGPHGTTTGVFTVSRHYSLYKGYNILCPNFTGSTGFGQKFLDGLPTKIGQIDCDEVVGTIEYCTKNGLGDPSRVVVAGGSYGGYLPCVIMAKFPKLFKCAIIRNPVVNAVNTYETSDIPEWTTGEVFNKEMDFEYTGEEIKKLYEASPIGMNRDIKTSILLMLGGKDRRVPPEGGVHYYKALKHAGVDITLLYYPEDEHSLASNQDTETDQFVRMFSYLDEKVN